MFLGGALHWMTIKLWVQKATGQSLLMILLLKIIGRFQCLEFKLTKFMNGVYVCLDVWLMNDYMVGNSWCKVFSLKRPEIVRSFMSVGPVAYLKSRKDVLIEVVMKNLIWYNLETKEIKVVKIANMSNSFHNLKVYTESLVAPDYFPSSDI